MTTTEKLTPSCSLACCYLHHYVLPNATLFLHRETNLVVASTTRVDAKEKNLGPEM